MYLTHTSFKTKREMYQAFIKSEHLWGIEKEYMFMVSETEFFLDVNT